jgi:hypothetical protein
LILDDLRLKDANFNLEQVMSELSENQQPIGDNVLSQNLQNKHQQLFQRHQYLQDQFSAGPPRSDRSTQETDEELSSAQMDFFRDGI